MGQPPKHLISIGDAWVDPRQVVAVDETFGPDDPRWANCRVILSTGHVVFGRRAPSRVAEAVRAPEREVALDEATEVFPETRRATLRSGRVEALRPIRPDPGDGRDA